MSASVLYDDALLTGLNPFCLSIVEFQCSPTQLATVGKCREESRHRNETHERVFQFKLTAFWYLSANGRHCVSRNTVGYLLRR